MKLGIIDYGICNVKSVLNAFKYIGCDAIVSSDSHDLLSCDKLILPGVGSYAVGMSALKASHLDDVIFTHLSQDKYLLGICLGMQLMLSVGMEGGRNQGLDLIPGEVLSLDGSHSFTGRVPNVGWRTVNPSPDHLLSKVLFDNIDNPLFYHVHSYYCSLNSPAHLLSTTLYGGLRYCSSVCNNYSLGVQFHPEKSGPAGLAFLKNFLII